MENDDCDLPVYVAQVAYGWEEDEYAKIVYAGHDIESARRAIQAKLDAYGEFNWSMITTWKNGVLLVNVKRDVHKKEIICT